MNKLLTKIVGAVLGASMAVGVGVGVAINSKEATPVHAVDELSYTLTAKCNSTDSDATTDVASSKTTLFTDATNITSTSGSKVYQGASSSESIKFGSSSAKGTLTINLASGGQKKATKVTFSIAAANDTSKKVILSLNGATSGTGYSLITYGSTAKSFNDYEVSWDGTTPLTSIKVEAEYASKNRFYLKNIKVYVASASVLTPLDAPTNVAWDSANNRVTWTGSENAGGYKVSINGGAWSDTTSNLYYPISTSPSTIYTVQVKAVPSPSDDSHSDSTAASVSFNTLVGEGTLADPYTVADAKAVIDSNTGLSGKYVTGIVSQIITSWGSNKITFDISSDGSTSSQQFRMYGCVSSTEHPISSDDDIEEGATIIGYGTLKKYNSIYEFDSGCKVVEYTAPTPVAKHDLTYAIGDHGVYDGTTEKSFEVAEGGIHTVLSAEDVGITAASGYAFTGWSDGTNTYQPDDEYTMGENDVTLTALWEVYVDPSTYFTKVTSASDITDGKYAIVYSNLMFDGSRSTLDAVSNTKELNLTNILSSYFTITSGKIKSASGYYIGNISDSNGLSADTSTQYENTVSIDESGNLVVVSSGGAYLRYNSASNQARFRYFKSSTYTSQKAIQLYKVNFDKVFEDAITCNGTVGSHSFNMGMVWKDNGTHTNLSLENLYNTLSTTNKAALSSATFAKYDYIVGKYYVVLHNDAYNDFMQRNPDPVPSANKVFFSNSENNEVITSVVIIVALISFTTIGGYFLLRKRKEQ